MSCGSMLAHMNRLQAMHIITRASASALLAVKSTHSLSLACSCFNAPALLAVKSTHSLRLACSCFNAPALLAAMSTHSLSLACSCFNAAVRTCSRRPTDRHIRSSITAKRARIGGHYAVQRHSSSPTLIPIESTYATYY